MTQYRRARDTPADEPRYSRIAEGGPVLLSVPVRLIAAVLAVTGLEVGAWALLWPRARRVARRRDARYRAVLEHSPNIVLIAEAVTLRILDANPTCLRLLGYSHAELSRLTLHQVFARERSGLTRDGADSAQEVSDANVLAGRFTDPDPRLPMSLRARCRDGSLLEVEATGHRLSLEGRAVVAITAGDVTLKRKIESELLEKQQHLDHLAHHDQLTGLPNRLYLAHRLPGAIEDAKRAGRMLAVLFLDLDRFKDINDSRGHETGDELLKAVAARVRSSVRDADIVVRMGGDEFIVVLQSVERSDLISETAARINEALSAPVVVNGRPLVTTASIGVSLFPRDGADMGELLRHSDTAMYQAKDHGRNNFQLFNPVMARRLRERVAIEASLRAALEQEQLDVHYQPIVHIASNRVTALEALLRWKHPTQGYILPARFIEVAEETGLIVPVGDFVLNRVLEDLVAWRAAGAVVVPVAVNVSAVQLQRANLRDRILALTRERGVSPELLQLELTESAMFDRRELRGGHARRDAVSELRELGLSVAIDDFGTGYSSLGYLKQWHVDYLKIDRSFVRDLVTDMSDLAIVTAIIAIARQFSITVVAEGIEGWQQLEKLRQLGCGLAQGNLFAKPAPAGECRTFLSGRPVSLTDAGAAAGALDLRAYATAAAGS
ncbi:MAG: putative bifunctional diguanylate cyclase/phosphodiesterase [Steroidobacteraceae bacterium]